jgi:hypothetical protein
MMKTDPSILDPPSTALPLLNLTYLLLPFAHRLSPCGSPCSRSSPVVACGLVTSAPGPSSATTRLCTLSFSLDMLRAQWLHHLRPIR